nr:dihydroorotase [Rhodothermus marinus]
MESGARKTPDLLIRGGILLDPETGRQRRADLLIRGGRIVGIAESIEADDVPVYDATGKFISPGWMDMHVHLREPGQEHKETIETGCRAAAFGGFTAVACMPNTDPPIHTRDVVEFVIERGRRTPVDVHPIACVSKNREGKELTEMADLVEGGAVAFSDDGSPVQHGGLMRRALEYASMLDRAIINHMEDLTLNPHGHMHEGVVSTRLGVPGIPPVAEEVMVARDLILAEYTGGHVHVAHISTARSVELVRQAKARGVRVTAEVCPHHFTLTDEAVERTGFSTNTKMHPPLRTAADIAAIKEGLRDGTIDAICTDHAPHASFEKEVEFIEAPFGSSVWRRPGADRSRADRAGRADRGRGGLQADGGPASHPAPSRAPTGRRRTGQPDHLRHDHALGFRGAAYPLEEPEHTVPRRGTGRARLGHLQPGLVRAPGALNLLVVRHGAIAKCPSTEGLQRKGHERPCTASACRRGLRRRVAGA